MFASCEKKDDLTGTENSLLGKWVAADYNSVHNDVIYFTAGMRVEDYFVRVTTTLHHSSSYYFTYVSTGNTVKIVSHQPETEAFSETFEYVLNGNSLIIKGFSNPFSATQEVRTDVRFTRAKVD
jgi:hypothetical protein